jgi:hypothetical protein
LSGRFLRPACEARRPRTARRPQGRLWREQGKRTEALDLLGPIYNWFTEGFVAPDLKDAKALLDELS